MKSYYLAKLLHKLRLTSYKNCYIDKDARVDSECVLSNVSIGKLSYVGSGTRITNATIGKYCSIGGKCGIGGGLHPINMVSTSPVFLKGRNILKRNIATIPYATSEKVIIGNDVWIGEGVFIMSGVEIGNGAIIGAHAVVTHNVSPYSVVVGIPGKTIKKRFDENIINKLQEINWWDWDDEKLKEYGSYFESPEMLLEIIGVEMVKK